MAGKHCPIPQLPSQSQLLLPKAGNRRTNQGSRGKLSMPKLNFPWQEVLMFARRTSEHHSPAADPKTCPDTKAKIPSYRIPLKKLPPVPGGERHTKSTGQNQRDLEMPSGCCSRVTEAHFSFERSIFILEVRSHFHALSISVSNPTLPDLSDLQTPKNFQLRQRAKES